MADAYYRVKHRPVATLTSTGPGTANLVMSLAAALSDSSAFMAITANVPTSQYNRAPFQELYKHNQADFPQVLRPVVKRAFQPTRVDMLPLALRQGLDTMVTGRPGPGEPGHPVQRLPGGGRRRAAGPRRTLDRAAPAPGAATPTWPRRWTCSLRRSGRCSSSATARRCPRPGPSSPSSRTGCGIPVITSPNGMGCLDMATTRWRSASSAATAPTRRTRRAATPTW